MRSIHSHQTDGKSKKGGKHFADYNAIVCNNPSGTEMSYRNVARNYIVPELGNKYMGTINRVHRQKCYKYAAGRSEAVSRAAKNLVKWHV